MAIDYGQCCCGKPSRNKYLKSIKLHDDKDESK